MELLHPGVALHHVAEAFVDDFEIPGHVFPLN
jgi:3,4-dihydroxy-2-butanone 4-phosphate synthase